MNIKQIAVLGATLVAPFVAGAQTQLINVDVSAFGTSESGVAAFGLTSSDVWNDAGFPTTQNLLYSDNTASVVDLSVSFEGDFGVFGTGSDDPMFHDYWYPDPGDAPDGGNITITVSSLPAGMYDFYVYAHGVDDDEIGIVELESGTKNYGTKQTSDSNWNKFSTTAWQEGQAICGFSERRDCFQWLSHVHCFSGAHG